MAGIHFKLLPDYLVRLVKDERPGFPDPAFAKATARQASRGMTGVWIPGYQFMSFRGLTTESTTYCLFLTGVAMLNDKSLYDNTNFSSPKGEVSIIPKSDTKDHDPENCNP